MASLSSVTNNKKPPAQRKRQRVTDPSGWTHIRIGPKPSPGGRNLLACQLTSLDLDDGSIDPTQVTEKQRKYDRIWRKSESCRELRKILEQDILPSLREDHHRSITKCVCLGLGSFTSGRESSKYELAALTWILDIFFLRDRCPLQEVVFQDPAFTLSDMEYLRSQGHQVLDSPRAFDRIDEATFLFAPHLEKNIYATALERELPVLSIGSDVETFIDQMAHLHSGSEVERREEAVFRRFNEAMLSESLPEFERDTWCYFTRIYWRKRMKLFPPSS